MKKCILWSSIEGFCLIFFFGGGSNVILGCLQLAMSTRADLELPDLSSSASQVPREQAPVTLAGITELIKRGKSHIYSKLMGLEDMLSGISLMQIPHALSCMETGKQSTSGSPELSACPKAWKREMGGSGQRIWSLTYTEQVLVVCTAPTVSNILLNTLK